MAYISIRTNPFFIFWFNNTFSITFFICSYSWLIIFITFAINFSIVHHFVQYFFYNLPAALQGYELAKSVHLLYRIWHRCQ